MKSTPVVRTLIACLLFITLSPHIYGQVPTNDDCSGAIPLNSSITCSPTVSGTVANATNSGVTATCTSNTTNPADDDVWYKFVAMSATQTITINPANGNPSLTKSGPVLELFSGICGSLTNIGCGTTSIATTGLTVGATYYIRVYSKSTGFPSGGATFDICVTHPVPPTPATYEISRTYINVTKGNTGGTVNPGDTLEMRAILAITSKTLDSLSFIDTLYNTKGLRLVPGSLSWRTNEGKIYGNGASAFTDANDADPGRYYTNGLDTIIKINIGSGSSGTARGVLSSTSYPRVFGSPCLIMATYRVVVYAPYNTKINFKTGALTYRDQATGALTNANFTSNNLIVYQSPGLCPNAVSATNALGAEANGTFDTPSGPTPLLRNRGTTPYIGTGYTYTPFNSSGGPGDYFYGIANNTSQNFTTTTTYAKPDPSGFRVFQQWDITGDHTGASNPTKGNPPCDINQPVSPTNPCGFMLVVNSAYKADTAFTYTINNLCPNTYYELSAWFKNVCYKCGADSLGRNAATAGYVPTAPGDSSGVRPNIAFDVNGTDYFTTGDIKYTGVTQAGSDSTNKWLKRGFVYLTGPAESSFQLTLRNNAPGGGGNDWALDDISVATCLPNMQYSPSLNPDVCESNPITINDTVRSYFNNHTYYKWQNSTDGGSSWNDIPGTEGNGSPVYKGSAWEYVTSYQVPPSQTTMANNNDKYRVIVATASTALANTNCQFTDGVSIIDVNVITCGPTLNIELLTFNGKLVNNLAELFWTTSKEGIEIEFDIERSNDGINFIKVGSVNGHNDNSEINYYTFNDPAPLTKETVYRIVMKNNQHRKISRQIRLYKEATDFKLANVINPFKNELLFDIVIDENTRVDISLTDMYGKQVTQRSYPVYQGVNSLRLDNTDALPAGIYILQVKNKDKKLNKRIFKK
jgi:trimeric autotransporter adhesin